MHNTQIDQLIWQVIASIPKGKVATYGQVARLAGYPSHARYVGATLKKLPKGTKLPWFRVINSQGRISFPEDSDGYKLQQQQLMEDGVEFYRGKISLRKFGWPI